MLERHVQLIKSICPDFDPSVYASHILFDAGMYAIHLAITPIYYSNTIGWNIWSYLGKDGDENTFSCGDRRYDPETFESEFLSDLKEMQEKAELQIARDYLDILIAKENMLPKLRKFIERK